MVELSILKLFAKSRDDYVRYNKAVSARAMETPHQNILRTIGRYYAQFPEHTYIAKDELLLFFRKEYPNLADKQVYPDLVDLIFTSEVSKDIASEYIKNYIEKDYANQMANVLLPVIDGSSSELDIEAIRTLIGEFKEATNRQDDEEESVIVPKDIRSALTKKSTDGLGWRLEALQRALGPLYGGSLGHIFARPETGKTTFVHSEASNFAQQLKDEECLLWINNEEDQDKILIRQFCAVCDATEQQINSNIEKAEKLFVKNGGSRMHLISRDTITLNDIEEWCRTYKPRIVFIDQGDKLHFKGESSAGNGADRLKMLYDNLRAMVLRLNKEWKIDVITIGQADAACDGKRWLYQTNLDSGKTGKAGAFDYICGIGNEYGDSDQRFLHLCKNKQQTVEPNLLRASVHIDRAKGMYYD